MKESFIKWRDRFFIAAGILTLLGVLYHFYNHSKFGYYIYISLVLWIILYTVSIKVRNYRRSFPEIFKYLYRYVESQYQELGKSKVININNLTDENTTKDLRYEHINEGFRDATQAIKNDESVHVIMSFDATDIIGDCCIEGIQKNIGNTVRKKLDKFEKQKKSNPDYNICNLYEISLLNIGAKITPIHTLRIMDLHVNQVVIAGAFSGDLIFDNCWIDSLIIDDAHSTSIRNIKLENCLCRILQIRGKIHLGVHGLSIIKSNINSIILPGGFDDRKIIEDKLLIVNSSIFSDVMGIYDKDIQQYRILQKIIQDNGDTVVERQIKAAVLEMERQVERDRTYQFVGWLYDHLSGYGTKPLRTLGWMAFLSLLSIALIYSSQTALPAINCESTHKTLGKSEYKQNITDYEKTICEKKTTDKTRVYLSIALGIKPIVNPLGFFQQSQTVKPKYPTVSCLLFIQWVLIIILLTLLIISIKGHFKLHD